MKLIKIALLLVGLYSAICGNPAIDQLAEGLGFIVKDYENALKKSAAVYVKYPDIEQALANPLTAPDIRAKVLDPMNMKIIFSSNNAAQKIGKDITKINDLLADPFEFVGPKEYMGAYFSDEPAFANFASTKEGKEFLSAFDALLKNFIPAPTIKQKNEVFSLIKDHIQLLIGKNAQKSFIEKITNDITINQKDIDKLITLLKKSDYFENTEEQLYKKLEELSGIKADELKKAFQQKINASESLENIILNNEKFWEDLRGTQLVANTTPVKKDYTDVFNELIDKNKGDYNRKNFAKELSVYPYPGDFKGFIKLIISKKDSIFGDPEKLLFDKLDDKNQKELALKNILQDKNNKVLHDLLIDPNNQYIIDLIKKSDAIKYLTNSDNNAQKYAIQKLTTLINNGTAKQELTQHSAILGQPKYQLYYLFNDKNTEEKNLRDTFYNNQNDPLTKALQGLDYNNMKDVVEIMTKHADKNSLLPYITNNNGTYNRTALAEVINKLNSAIRGKDEPNQKTYRHTLQEYLNNMTPVNKVSYDQIKAFINKDTNNLKDLSGLLNTNDRLMIEKLNDLEKTLASGDNFNRLKTLWSTSLNDKKFDVFKKTLAMRPLALQRLAEFCSDDCAEAFTKSDASNLNDALDDIEKASSEDDIIQAIEW